MATITSFDSRYAMGLFALAITSILIQKRRQKRIKEGKEAPSRRTSLLQNEYFPPLPDEIVEVLRTSKLCYLATQSDGNPHLSLMNFTYCRDEEVIILSTRRNTKKFCQIVENPKVAVLIHDFPAQALPSSPSATMKSPTQEAKQWSITLNGVAEATNDEENMTKYYRKLHSENNPDYQQFIVGADIAVLIIHIDKARMCDVQDRVSYWNARDGICSTELGNW